MVKSIFKSKTFWLAVLQFIVGGITALQSDPTYSTIGWLTVLKSIVDVALRIYTYKEVTVIQ